MGSGGEGAEGVHVNGGEKQEERAFTLMAGKSRVPAAVTSYTRFTPVVVSSDTPWKKGAWGWTP